MDNEYFSIVQILTKTNHRKFYCLLGHKLSQNYDFLETFDTMIFLLRFWLFDIQRCWTLFSFVYFEIITNVLFQRGRDFSQNLLFSETLSALNQKLSLKQTSQQICIATVLSRELLFSRKQWYSISSTLYLVISKSLKHVALQTHFVVYVALSHHLSKCLHIFLLS